MCHLPRYDAASLLDLDARCREGGRAWQQAVRELGDYVVHLIGLWPL